MVPTPVGREAFARELSELRSAGLLRDRSVVRGGLDFTSNDYLGLRRDPTLRRIAREAIEQQGTGAGAARLLGGGTACASALEREVAAWLGEEAALLFPSGYQANVGLLPVLAGERDVVLSDSLIHASSIDACRLARARVEVFAHGDLTVLEQKLRAARDARRRIVLVEGVYGMDGDVIDLAAVDALCVEHDAWLVVDEAHAAGLLGPRREGAYAAARAESVEPDGPTALVARIVTCGKALGAAGALVVGSSALCDLLANRARSFIFSTAPTPASVAVAKAAVGRIQTDADPSSRALAASRRLAAALDLPAPDAAIVPFVVGDSEEAVALAEDLQAAGFDVRAVRPPTVPAGTSRLRLVCHAHNEAAEIDALARAIRARTSRSGRLDSTRRPASTPS